MNARFASVRTGEVTPAGLGIAPGQPRKLILRNHQSPGDLVMLTAAVRDLHRCYPGEFLTDVRTSCPALWVRHPHVTPLTEDEAGVAEIECHYPLIHESNTRPYHFLFGFIEDLNQKLGLAIRPTEFRGCVPLAPEEKQWMSQIHEITGEDTPFWIIVAGGKFDFTTKWWDPRRYQDVVDHFRGRIQFVQVGEDSHQHPALRGVIDLRGRTDLRQFARLMYHAQGVVSPVTLAMHLAAAVETRPDRPKNRACVVIAGGREPAQWEAYPHHQFIHTGGALLCCDAGGCWKTRTVPLGDGDEKDDPRHLCAQPVALPDTTEADAIRHLPRCLDLISAEEVIRRVELYFTGGALSYLTKAQARKAKTAAERFNASRTLAVELIPPAPTRRDGVPPSSKSSAASPPIIKEAGTATLLERSEDAAIVEHRRRLEALVARDIPYPAQRFTGRGIVICGGGRKYLPCAWVAVKMLRLHGCKLPIELWHLGAKEMPPVVASALANLGVRCVDGEAVRREHPARILNGWELKCYAALHCAFEEVLLLDADNVAVDNPAYLFDSGPYREHGAIFWPDFGRLSRQRSIWQICGVSYRDEPEFESGQMVIDKRRCWKALTLAMHFNEHSDFYYRYVYGDKETFHLAWRKLGQPYAMPRRGIDAIPHTMCQHDFAGHRIFQHRNMDKWRLHGGNRTVPGFRFENECLAFVRELEEFWPDAAPGVHRYAEKNRPPEIRALAAELCGREYRYHRLGHDHRALTFRENGRLGRGRGGAELFWDLRSSDPEGHAPACPGTRRSASLRLELSDADGLTAWLTLDPDGTWRGRWVRFERMPVELTPQPASVGTPPLAPHSTLNFQPSTAFAQRMPRVIHQIWLGSRPLPEQAHAFAQSWQQHHPGWAYRLWTNADLADFELVNAAAFHAAPNAAMKSDLLRLEILHRHGGLYVDVDFECLRPFFTLLAQVGEDCFAGFEPSTVTHTHSLCNALIGALPGAKFLAEAIRRLPENIRTHETALSTHGAEYIARATGPAFFTRLAAECPCITAFPQPVLYPANTEQAATAHARHGYWGTWRTPTQQQTAYALLEPTIH